MMMIRQLQEGAGRPNIREALRGLRVLVRDPNDTAEGFRVVEALDPRIHHRELARMSSEPSGQRLLRDRPVLLDALRARALLDRMPEGSLGRAYRDFCAREGIDPNGFVEVGEAGSQQIDDVLVRYAALRSRDSHDIWHVVCGYGSDMAGESAILAFTWAQTRSPGLLMLLIGAVLHSFAVRGKRGRTMRRMLRVGLRNGRNARPLAAAPWEEWLARPIAEVRAELGISEPPAYEQVWAARTQRHVPAPSE